MINSGNSGIELDGVYGVDNLINQGQITAGRGEDDSGLAVGMIADGVTMKGVIANTGTIDAREAGIAGFEVDGATGLVNQGDITTDGYGVYLAESVVDGDIVNGVAQEVDGEQVVKGTIKAGYVGLMLGGLDGVQNIANNGEITVTYGDGATVYSSNISGVVANTGVIEAGRTGMGLYGVDGTSFVNNGSITAGTFAGDGEGPGPEAFGNGMNLFSSNMAGAFVNNSEGVITAATDGMTAGDTDGLTDFVTLTLLMPAIMA